MSNRFHVPGGSSSPPSTPDKSEKKQQSYGSYIPYGENPSTTPAGPPPPSSAASFTPAGAPSASYLGSSIMRGMSGGPSFKQPSFGFSGTGTNTGGIGVGSMASTGNNNKNLFGGGGSGQQTRKAAAAAPLGRSIRGYKTGATRPSKLRDLLVPDEDEDEDAEGEEEEEEMPVASQRGRVGGDNAAAAASRPGTFTIPFDESYDEGEEDDEDEEEGDENHPDPHPRAYQSRGGMVSDEEDDMWLGMQGGGTPRRGFGGDIGDASDLMMLNTPAATERVRREAEDIFRASAMQSGPRRRHYQFATLAKDVYNQMGTAPITEPAQLILGTEALINRLYDDGVGEADDEDKLDDTLATVAGKATMLWKGYADKMPLTEEEHAAEIGPGPNASPFEKASYLANLALRIHHTRYDHDGMAGAEPLPETLFQWQHEFHNPYGSQVEDILRYRPSPACHSLFWETIFIALVRGRVGDATKLLKQAGWGHVRRAQRGEYAYQDTALKNVQKAVEDIVAVLETCPGFAGNWEIWSSEWTLFRVRAQGGLEYLRRFAEGRDDLGESTSTFAASARSARGRESMAGLARRAESQIPWDIYENMNVIFDIVLGSQNAILEAAQDWCEATIGLLGWWDESRGDKPVPGVGFSRSQALIPLGMGVDTESYLDRLSRAFHSSVESEFQLNSLSPVEIGIACVFEDNIKAVVGILRGWSLPIASAVAEIASLGKWLPQHQPSGAFAMDDLDMDDLEVLGMDPGAPDEIDGIKDSTLVQYAQSLAELEDDLRASVREEVSRDGWELAIHVLGRLDSPERSEEMVSLLVRNLIEGLHVDSEATVEKIWGILNELGMIPFAEETAEVGSFSSFTLVYLCGATN